MFVLTNDTVFPMILNVSRKRWCAYKNGDMANGSCFPTIVVCIPIFAKAETSGRKLRRSRKPSGIFSKPSEKNFINVAEMKSRIKKW